MKKPNLLRYTHRFLVQRILNIRFTRSLVCASHLRLFDQITTQ